MIVKQKELGSLHLLFCILEPPTIQVQPGTLDVILNNPIILPCEAVGLPHPIITWQKEGISVITTGIVLFFSSAKSL